MISSNFELNPPNKNADTSGYKDVLISEMKKEIFELRQNQKEIENLSETLIELEERCNRYERERVEIERNYENSFFEQNDLIKQLKRSNEKLKNENEKLRLKNRCRRSQVEADSLYPRVDKKLNEVIKINCNLEDEVRDLRKKNMQLKKDMDGLRKVIFSTQGEKEKATLENERLKMKGENMKKVNIQLKGRIENYQSSNLISNKKYEEYLDKIRRKEDEINHMRNQIGKCERQNVDHMEQNKNLVALVEQLMKEIEKFNREDRLASRMLNRKETIEKIKRDCVSPAKERLRRRNIL